MPNLEPITQAELVNQRLVEIGMSVSEFARRLGVAPSYIHSIKTGKRRIAKPSTVERAAEVLGISADTLYVSAGLLPPDAWTIIQRRPEMVQAVRLLDARLADREAQ